MLTHRNVYLHAFSVLAAGQTSPATLTDMSCRSVLLHTIPLFHANGWGTAHTITVVGGTHVMFRHFSPAEVFRLIERERVTDLRHGAYHGNALVHSPDTARVRLEQPTADYDRWGRVFPNTGESKRSRNCAAPASPATA